jgi:F0F1-type ATP synthase assembly protein I
MSKPGKVVLTVLLLAGFGAALFFALRGQKAEQDRRPKPRRSPRPPS